MLNAWKFEIKQITVKLVISEVWTNANQKKEQGLSIGGRRGHSKTTPGYERNPICFRNEYSIECFMWSLKYSMRQPKKDKNEARKDGRLLSIGSRECS